jgi:tight adherence protein B
MSSVANLGALMASGVNMQTALELAGLKRNGESQIERLLSFAISSGAPMGAVTRRLVAFELDLERFRSELETANAVPIATRKLLLWLPALSLVMGQLAGFGTIAAIFQPIGAIALCVAGALILVGIKWSGRLLKPLLQEQPHPAFEYLKFSLLLAAGAPLNKSHPKGLAHLVDLSRLAGAPLRKLVEVEIELVTQRALQLSMTRAKRMSIDLLVPMSLTVLPAFLILTVVPMLIGFGL